MSEGTTPDLSRIVGLIMENPKLIEEISSLVKQESGVEPENEAEVKSQEDQTVEKAEEVSVLTTNVDNSRKKNRSELLSAFKPYVSSERAKAIDSMISIANVLDAIRR